MIILLRWKERLASGARPYSGVEYILIQLDPEDQDTLELGLRVTGSIMDPMSPLMRFSSTEQAVRVMSRTLFNKEVYPW